MAVSIRGPVGSNSGNAGTSGGGSITVPSDARTGELALLVVTASNASAINVTTSGWSRVGTQQTHTGTSTSSTLFTRTLPGTSGAVSSEAGTSVAFTIATATRWSAELTVVANAGTPEVATLVNYNSTSASMNLPTMTPSFNDAFMVYLFGGSLAATTTPNYTVTSGVTEAAESFTTNTSGRVAGAWVGTRQRSGGAGTVTNTYTLTPSTNAVGTGWLYAFPASVTVAVAQYTRTNQVKIDSTGSVGTMTLTQTDSTGETATISGPTSGVFTVTLPATHTQTLTFDLKATNGAATDTETIAISPMGSGVAAGPKVRVSGSWV